MPENDLQNTPVESQRPSAFVSYAREDKAFVKRLRDDLQLKTIELNGDWGLTPGQDYEARLRSLILASDVFVFIISPDSILSTACKKEIALAVEFKKRILPVSHRDHGEDVLLDSAIRVPQWTSLREGDDYEQGISNLIQAIKTDFDLMDMHSRLLVAADDWDQNSRNRNYLLHKDGLKKAEVWLKVTSGNPDKLPQPTPLELELIFASQRNRSRATRITFAMAMGVAVFLAVAGVVAIAKGIEAVRNGNEAQRQGRIAKENEERANENAIEARKQQVIAETKSAEALRQSKIAEARRIAEMKQRQIAVKQTELANDRRKEAERQSRIALARQLAAQADVAYGQSDDLLERGVLLAVESAKRFPGRSLETDLALRRGLNLLAMPLLKVRHPDSIYGLAISPDGNLVATASGGIVKIWELTSGKEVTHLSHSDTVFDVAFSPDGTHIATADGKARIWQANDGQGMTVFDPGGFVSKVIFSPTGKYFATISGDTAIVWDLSTRQQVSRVAHDNELRGKIFSKSINNLVFSKDETHFATSSEDFTARIWETLTGKETARMVHSDRVGKVAFSPDGSIVASACGDLALRLWNAQTGEEISRLEHDGPLTSISFSPDGKYIATGGSIRSGGVNEGNTTRFFTNKDYAARVWRVEDGKQIARLPHQDSVWAAVFSPDGKYLATGSSDKTARIWEIEKGQEIARMVHEGRVTKVAYSRDAKYLVTSVEKTTDEQKAVDVWVWNTKGASAVATMVHDKGESVSGIAFSPNGRYLATASSGLAARVWDQTSGELIHREYHPGGAYSVAYSPDGKHLAIGFDNAQIDPVHRIQTSKENVTVLLLKESPIGYLPQYENEAGLTHGSTVYEVVFSPDGRYLASRGDDQTVRIFDVATKLQTARLKHNRPIEKIAFSPDGQYLATASSDTVRLWSPTTGIEFVHMKHDGAITSLMFAPKGKYLITGSGDKTARLWDVTSGRQLAKMTHLDSVSAVAFDQQGRFLATAGKDKTARVWRAGDGHEVARMRHEAAVTSVLFSPDGNYIATASNDKTTRVWDAASGREVTRLTYEDISSKIAFDPTGRYLLISNGNKLIKQYWETEDLMNEACARLRRNLTAEEWDQYISEKHQDTCSKLRQHQGSY